MPTFPYNNFHLVMTAVKDIAAGEEICVSYLDECNLSRSRHSRINILRLGKNFFGVYMHTCMHMHIHSNTNINKYTHTNRKIHTKKYTNKPIHIQIHICIYATMSGALNYLVLFILQW